MRYRCGACGGTGHNARTCGKTKPQMPPKKRSPRARGEGNILTSPTVSTCADINLPASGKEDNLAAGDNLDDAEAMTADDLSVWWELAKPENMDEREENPQRVETLARLLNTAEASGTKPVEMKKFLGAFNEQIWAGLAKHDDVPDMFLVIAATGRTTNVKMQIAYRDKLPAPLARRLLRDENTNVAASVLGRDKTNFTEQDIEEFVQLLHSRGLARDYTINGWWGSVLKHPNCPPRYLVEAIEEKHRDENMCSIALSNPNTPPELLEKVFRHETGQRKLPAYNTLLVSVCENPSMPRKVLQDFVSTYSQDDRFTDIATYLAAVRNRSLPSEFLEKEYDARFGANTYGFGRTTEPVIHSFMLNPNFPVERIRQIANSDLSYYTIDEAKKILAQRSP